MNAPAAVLSRAAVALLGAAPALSAATFGEDAAFLARHTEIIVLSDAKGVAKVAVAPAYQGRVMTSTAGSDAGLSFGWINRELIESGRVLPHINPLGGEDRFWLGPEGGQFSIFFAKGAKFELADWYTPAPLDTLPFKTASQSRARAEFTASFSLTNYSGYRFDIGVHRTIRLLSPSAAWRALQVPAPQDVQMVAYRTENKLTNRGDAPWRKETGLLSVWILGMFNPSESTTIVVPIRPGSDASLGTRVTSDYFGPVPTDRLAVRDEVLFFSGDGKYRSKIGVNPRRSRARAGSYDVEHHALTLVQFSQPADAVDYVNSLWKLQEHPFAGDAVNSYNDGPPSPGAKPLGPFYELESSSPAAALAPGKSLTHSHLTVHLTGSEAGLDAAARGFLGVDLAEIQAGLKGR
jgi:hypothetical protein